MSGSKQIGAKKYDQSTLQHAVDAIRGRSMSLRAAARAYNIPRATLFDKISNRRSMDPSPKTVLTSEEEARIVAWIVHMARIGYGRTRNEVLETVKRMLDIDGRPNPFKDNKPGKDWWYGFVKRHPQISERLPQHLGKERAVITPAKVTKWFDDYKKYVLEEIKDPSLLLEPSRLYNADESGFSMCPKTGKVLAKKGSSSVYNFGSSEKTQITVLACMGATGHFMKPLLVYPGQRFSYNPLEGFEEAMMGRTENGWMDSDLFSTWLEELFIPQVNERGVKKPVVLFVDGHSTHMSMRVSDICRQNGIELYCLLEHASHLMQPCDLRLFSNLKVAWKQAVRDFQFKNIGEHVNKRTFAQVFKEAWTQSTTVTVAVNGFRDAGLFPLDPMKVLMTTKMDPSSIFRTPEKTVEDPQKPEESGLSQTAVAPHPPSLSPNTVASPTTPCDQPDPATPSLSADIPTPEVAAASNATRTSDALDDVLTVPVALSLKKTTIRREPMPKAITGDKYREMLEDKQRKKEQAEREKEERKQRREINKKQREQEKQRRQQLREEKKKEREERQMQKKIEKRLKELKRQEMKKRKHADSSDESITPELSDSAGSDLLSETDGNNCSICGELFDDSPFWIKCFNCPRIFHRLCIKTIDLCAMTEDEIEALQFECDFC